MTSPSKPKTLVAAVQVKGGKIILPNRAVFAAAIKHWPDCAADLELRPFEETRRGRANRYYWGVVLKLIAVESGHSAEEIHHLMKMRHHSTVINVMGFPGWTLDTQTQVPLSTARMTISEFSRFIELVMLDGAEWLGITFPEPRASEEYRDASEAKV